MARTIYTQDTRDRLNKRELERETRKYQADAEQFEGFSPDEMPSFNKRVGIAARLRPDLDKKTLRDLERRRVDSLSLGTDFKEYLPIRRARGSSNGGSPAENTLDQNMQAWGSEIEKQEAVRQREEQRRLAEQEKQAERRGDISGAIDLATQDRLDKRREDESEDIAKAREDEVKRAEREKKDFQTEKGRAYKSAKTDYFNEQLSPIEPEYRAYVQKLGELEAQKDKVDARIDSNNGTGEDVDLQARLAEEIAALKAENSDIVAKRDSILDDQRAFNAYLGQADGDLLEAAKMRERELVERGESPDDDKLVQVARDTARRWMSPEARESAKLYDSAEVYASLPDDERQKKQEIVKALAQSLYAEAIR